jgi:hypothetical protein
MKKQKKINRKKLERIIQKMISKQTPNFGRVIVKGFVYSKKDIITDETN